MWQSFPVGSPPRLEPASSDNPGPVLVPLCGFALAGREWPSRDSTGTQGDHDSRFNHSFIHSLTQHSLSIPALLEFTARTVSLFLHTYCVSGTEFGTGDPR